MPDVGPAPPRGDVAPRDEDLRAAGLSPKFVKGGGDQLKKLILGAALAMRQKRHPDAVTLQARAAALCAEMEMPREQILNVTILAGTCSPPSARTRARPTPGARMALTHQFDDLIAQTELALGMLDAVDKLPAKPPATTQPPGSTPRRPTSARWPSSAGAWRASLRWRRGWKRAAVDCWKRALALAEPLEPELAKLTSAAEVARALAAVCRKRGLSAQADSLEQKSVELEADRADQAAKAAAS